MIVVPQRIEVEIGQTVELRCSLVPDNVVVVDVSYEWTRTDGASVEAESAQGQILRLVK